ncbi:MAG: hydroxypyruvate isomerase family protein [Reyranella sp.]|uniref:2-oxo-tetronate isomerase n=1 Tax=Reyranella sp. TaxID=1929291 RepID=UPI00122719FF|nr:2-oxo-tetronate isomerase [Reyranella sp.]TAJ90617.1 MAG: hydroxypyruvate isomerase family protein [Reyranella sp.]
MPKLAANLSWIYQEVPFLKRFGAAAAHGFKAVEILFPYEAPAAEIAAELKRHKLTQALFNLPPGDAGKGERGLAALPGREAEFAAAIDKALDYAQALECRTLHVMSGMIAPGADVKAMHRTFISNLRKICDRTAKMDITVVLEPINRRDIPGYFTNTTDQVKAIIDQVGAPHLRLQLDLYHLQVTEGDLQKRMERLFPITSHVQIAGNPDRNEPDIGEVNHLYLLDVLDRLGYDGYVGLEYKPKTTTGAGLGWAAKYGIKA